MSRVWWKTNVQYDEVIWVFNSTGAGVTGLVNSDFTLKTIIKNGARVTTPAFTLTEIDSTNAAGAYLFSVTPDADAEWHYRFRHATYNVRGWSIDLQTAARAIADLAYPATSGRSLAVDASGRADANVALWLGSAPNALASGRVDAKVGAMAANVLDSTAMADDTITAAKIAADAIGSSEIADNAIGASKIATGAFTASKFAAGAIAAATFASGALDAVWSTATRALTDKAGYALSTAGVQAIWDALTSALTNAGSIGKYLVDGLASIASSIAALPGASTIASAVANEALSGHTTAGSLGEAILRLRQAVVVGSGTFQNGSTLDAAASSDDNAYRNGILLVTEGTGAGQFTSIWTYNGTTKAFTGRSNLQGSVGDGTSKYVILAAPVYVGQANVSSMDANVIDANVIADDAIDAGAVKANAVTKIAAGVLLDTSKKLLTDASGKVSVYELGTDTVNGASLASDAIAELKAAVAAISVAGIPLDEALRRIGATTAGDVVGMETGAPIFKDFAGNPAVTSTTDENGNRTGTAYPPSP